MMEVKIIYSSLESPVEPESINELCRKCKLFRGNTNLNNGYGCLEQDKDYPGKCYSFDCPIAYPMDAEEWEELGESPDGYEPEEWVRQYRKVDRIV